MQCVHVLPVANRLQDQTARDEIRFARHGLKYPNRPGEGIAGMRKIQTPNF